MVVLLIMSNGYVIASDLSVYTVDFFKSRFCKFDLKLLHEMSINARVIKVLLCVRLINIGSDTGIQDNGFSAVIDRVFVLSGIGFEQAA